MNAIVEVQNVRLPPMELAQAHRAVCWDHPQTDYLIPPWMGEVYVIGTGEPSWYSAALEAKMHNRRLHPDNAPMKEFDQLL